MPEIADRAVERFLQTVMVIDDNAEFGQEPTARKLKTPSSDAPAAGDGEGTEVDEVPAPRQAVLNAKTLVDGFARRGLVCGVMRPDPPDEPDRATVMPAAQRADIVILDWHLVEGDDGGRALDILAALAERPGLRLVAIYTYEDKLDEIANEIAKRLGGERDACRIVAGDLVVEVYAKEGTVLESDVGDRVKTTSELPPQLIADFARLTVGLIPTAAVATIGALRESTPRVLALLGPELDPGYLGHRVLLADPDESSLTLLDLIGAELRTVAEDDPIVQAALGQEAIEELVESLDLGTSPLTREILCEALRIGVTRRESREAIGRHAEVQALGAHGFPSLFHAHKSPTRHFTKGDEDAARKADVRFAQAVSLRSETGTPPQLQLGTIVRGEEWLICVQPDCDAIRLDGPREFPFVRARPVEIDARQDYVVATNAGPQALEVELHLYSARLVEFAPTGGERLVRASGDPGHFVFVSVSEGDFTFVAQLRREHSRKLASDFFQTGSRMGLDESEVQRRWREKR